METATKTLHCPSCAHTWESLEEFLSDPQAVLLGYQVHFRQQTCGFFLFNHMTCRTTMGVGATEFLSMAGMPIFNQSTRPNGRCPEFCLRSGDSDEAPGLCDCSFVQEIVNAIQNWTKNENR